MKTKSLHLEQFFYRPDAFPDRPTESKHSDQGTTTTQEIKQDCEK